MSKLNEKLLKKYRDNIAISNLKEEFIMKRYVKRQILFLSIMLMVLLSGSFLTVNAVTDGKLVNDIKDKIKVVFVKNDKEEKEVEGKVYTDSDGNEWVNYEYKNKNYTFNTKVNKSELEKENMTIDEKIHENDGEALAEVTIK